MGRLSGNARLLSDPAPEPFYPDLPKLSFWKAAFDGLALKKSDIETLIDTDDTMTDDEKYLMRLDVIDAERYQRFNPSMVALYQKLGIPDEQVNSLWLWAATFT